MKYSDYISCRKTAKHVQVFIYDENDKLIEKSPIFNSYFSLELDEWVDKKLDKLPGVSYEWEDEDSKEYDFVYKDIDKDIVLNSCNSYELMMNR